MRPTADQMLAVAANQALSENDTDKAKRILDVMTAHAARYTFSDSRTGDVLAPTLDDVTRTTDMVGTGTDDPDATVEDDLLHTEADWIKQPGVVGVGASARRSRQFAGLASTQPAAAPTAVPAAGYDLTDLLGN